MNDSSSGDSEKSKNRGRIKSLLKIKPTPMEEFLATHVQYEYSKKELEDLAPVFNSDMILCFRDKSKPQFLRIRNPEMYLTYSGDRKSSFFSKMTDAEYINYKINKSTTKCICCHSGHKDNKPELHVQYETLEVINEFGEVIGHEYHVCEETLRVSKKYTIK